MVRMSTPGISASTAVEATIGHGPPTARHGPRLLGGRAGIWPAVTAILLAARFGLDGFAPGLTAAHWYEGMKWVTEIWIVAGLMAWVVRSAAGRERLQGVQGHLVRTLLVVATIVHLVPLIPHTYPFAHWSMYTVPAREIVYSEVRLVSGTGDDLGPLPIADLVPGRPARAFSDLLDDWLDRVDSGELGARGVLAEAMHGFLQRIDDPVVAGVEIRRCIVSDPTPQRPAACRRAMVVRR